MSLYTHDCKECVPLGAYRGHDLYFHPGTLATLIARYGDSGEDYYSGMSPARDGILIEAQRLARERGLIT